MAVRAINRSAACMFQNDTFVFFLRQLTLRCFFSFTHADISLMECVLDETSAGFKSGSSDYWQQRLASRYYDTVRLLTYQYAPDAKSLLDVGSFNTPFAATFSWVENKTILNPGYPAGFVAPNNVVAVNADFYTYVCPSDPFDIVLCSQVLEHLEDPGSFLVKLLECGRTVVVSTPYLWPQHSLNVPGGHLHDDIDIHTLEAWARKRSVTFAVVSEESGTQSAAAFDLSRRIIVVFKGGNSLN